MSWPFPFPKMPKAQGVVCQECGGDALHTTTDEQGVPHAWCFEHCPDCHALEAS